MAQTAQDSADSIREQRSSLLDRYRQNNLTEDQAEALTGTAVSVSGGRSAKSGAATANTTRVVAMTCRKGPKAFTSQDGTYLSTVSCVKGTGLTMRVCTPDRPSTDPACPTVSTPGGGLTVSYTNTTLSVSLAACPDPATEGCDFRVTMNGSGSTSWNRTTIESDGAAAAARPETLGARTNNAVTSNPQTMSAYSAVNKEEQYTRMSTLESGAAAGRLVTGDGTDLGALNQGGSCTKTCLDEVGEGTTTKQCVQAMDAFTSGCQTRIPTMQENYTIGRANATCQATHPATCAPASPPPAGYGAWIKYREDPIASARVTGTVYTISYASFENFSAGPPPSKPFTNRTTSGPQITDASRCQRSGGSCVQLDPDVSGQCRQYQVRYYCPYDKASTCANSEFIAGLPPPPAGTANTTQFNNPGPQAYTLPDGRACSYSDTSRDPEAVADGEPTCTQAQDGVCINIPGTAECATTDTGPPPCTGPKYDGCTRGTPVCSNTSPTGACSEYTTDYTCPTTNPQCQRYKTTCTSNGIVYSEEESATSSGWQNAISTMSAIDQMTSEAKDACKKDGTCDMTNIRIFNGKGEGCKRQLGSSFAGKLCDFSPPDYSGTSSTQSPCLFGPIRTNCCDEDLNAEQNSLIGGDCSSGDVSLAAARRQSRAFRVNERCTDRINLGFSKPCIERTQYWCWWPTVMAKEVNVQGREQLKAIYATTSSAVDATSTMNWSYVATNETGNFTPVTILGNARLMAWQWPQYCTYPSDPRQSASNCGSGRTSILMQCQAKDCDTVKPTHPKKSSVDAPNWYAIDINRYGEGPATYSLGRYGFAEGTCDGTTCSFQLSTANEARSRNSVGLMELNWPWTDPETGVGERVMNSKYAMIAFPKAPGTPVGGSASIGVSAAPNMTNPDATVYTYYNLPTDGSARTITIAGKTIKVQGECDTRTNLCNHRFYVPQTVTQKRWNRNGTSDTVRSTGELDCSGFTMEEFGLLDLGKMNLEPVIESMTNGNKGAKLFAAQNTTGTYATTAQSTFTKKEAEYNEGKTQVRNPTGYASSVVTLTPAAGKAPWTTTLTYPSLYPASSTQDYNNDPVNPKGTRVHEVTINWGDGSTTNHFPGASAMNNVQHTYAAGPNLLEKDYEITVTFKLDAAGDGFAIPTPVGGNFTSCGTGCMIAKLGRDTIRNGGNCAFRSDSETMFIARPELIDSAIIRMVSFDDWMRIKVNGNIIYNADPNWTYPGARCGENPGGRGTFYPNLDVTAAFRNATPGANVNIGYDLATADDGHGEALIEIRISEPCRLATDNCPNGHGGNGLTRVVKAKAASRYDESDLSRSSGGAEDSVTEMDVRPPTGTAVPSAR